MPAAPYVGQCIRCHKRIPDEVQHHSKGACAPCAKQIQREKVTVMHKSGTIEGAAATEVMANPERGSHGLAELLLGADAQRFMTVHNDKRADLYIRDQRNVWIQLTGDKDRSAQESTAIYALASELREAQSSERPEIDKEWLADSAGSIIASIPSMRMLARFRNVQALREEELDWQPHGVFPLIDGILDAATEKFSILDSADEEWFMTDRVSLHLTKAEAESVINLQLASVPDSTREDIDWLMERHRQFFKMVAYRLNMVDKGIDHYRDQTSGAGKSLAARLMERSLPGLVKVIEIESKTFELQKWSEINTHLASRRVTIADEAGMVSLSRAVATELTGSEVPLAPKRVQHHMEPRKGSLIMLGADWSFVSTDAQGVQERVGQVAEGAGKSVEAAEMEGIYGRLEKNLVAKRYLAKKMLQLQVGARPVVEEGRRDDLIERGRFSPLQRFVYQSLEFTGRYDLNSADLSELSSHKLLKAHNLTVAQLYGGLLKSIEHVYGKLDEIYVVRDADAKSKQITAIRGFRIRWGT